MGKDRKHMKKLRKKKAEKILQKITGKKK